MFCLAERVVVMLKDFVDQSTGSVVLPGDVVSVLFGQIVGVRTIEPEPLDRRGPLTGGVVAVVELGQAGVLADVVRRTSRGVSAVIALELILSRCKLKVNRQGPGIHDSEPSVVTIL